MRLVFVLAVALAGVALPLAPQTLNQSTASVADSKSAQQQAERQSDDLAQQDPTQHDQTQKNDAQNDERKGEWVLAPIPIKSPAIGAGLQFVVARLFYVNKQDKVSPPSALGLGGVFTNNGSRAIALGGRLYLSRRTNIGLRPDMVARTSTPTFTASAGWPAIEGYSCR